MRTTGTLSLEFILEHTITQSRYKASVSFGIGRRNSLSFIHILIYRRSLRTTQQIIKLIIALYKKIFRNCPKSDLLTIDYNHALP